MKNYKLIIAYDGSRYQGWQRLGHTQDTIQGKIETVLSKYYQKSIQIDGSGRTDAGVHAKGQVASAFLPTEKIELEDLEAINHYLPADIQILRIEPADDRFHARYQAKRKCYRYRIALPPVGNVFERKYMTTIDEPLTLGKMRKAAEALVGTHDFRSFTTMKSKKKSTVRTLESITVTQPTSGEVQIDFVGNGFLRQQVRIMAGILIQVGTGVIPASRVKEILQEKSRANTRMIAPAKGLCLEEVNY